MLGERKKKDAENTQQQGAPPHPYTSRVYDVDRSQAHAQRQRAQQRTQGIDESPTAPRLGQDEAYDDFMLRRGMDADAGVVAPGIALSGRGRGKMPAFDDAP